ncbi:hypothetical protein J6590_068140 [Homalodisca vitripennis]|nr:hypothetical protein J6590_068140 [Homalodisca vitripennis]
MTLCILVKIDFLPKQRLINVSRRRLELVFVHLVMALSARCLKTGIDRNNEEVDAFSIHFVMVNKACGVREYLAKLVGTASPVFPNNQIVFNRGNRRFAAQSVTGDNNTERLRTGRIYTSSKKSTLNLSTTNHVVHRKQSILPIGLLLAWDILTFKKRPKV